MADTALVSLGMATPGALISAATWRTSPSRADWAWLTSRSTPFRARRAADPNLSFPAGAPATG